MISATCAASVTGWCELIAVLLAIVAATAWVIATRYPAAKPGPGFYGSSDPNHQIWKDLAQAGKKIDAGGRWNTWAAVLTGLSAIAAAFSLLLPKLVCS